MTTLLTSLVTTSFGLVTKTAKLITAALVTAQLVTSAMPGALHSSA